MESKTICNCTTGKKQRMKMAFLNIKKKFGTSPEKQAPKQAAIQTTKPAPIQASKPAPPSTLQLQNVNNNSVSDDVFTYASDEFLIQKLVALLRNNNQ